jgi:hypothetical protein
MNAREMDVWLWNDLLDLARKRYIPLTSNFVVAYITQFHFSIVVI